MISIHMIKAICHVQAMIVANQRYIVSHDLLSFSTWTIANTNAKKQQTNKTNKNTIHGSR